MKNRNSSKASALPAQLNVPPVNGMNALTSCCQEGSRVDSFQRSGKKRSGWLKLVEERWRLRVLDETYWGRGVKRGKEGEGRVGED